MSDISLKWLVENFPEKCNFFDIGAANLSDTVTFKQLMPNNTYYAFECSDIWKEQNIITAERYGINYFHLAMSDTSDVVQFYPSIKNHEGNDWPWSGSIYAPGTYLATTGLEFGEGYTVPSITLNEFCKEHPAPDFIHIDAQGAEYSIFKNMEIRPSAIWAEISAFHLYDTSVTYQQFNDMMLSYGYKQAYLDNNDSLYIRSDLIFTDYPNSK
jgi:FkbM family methyltransferase